jgi:transcriptional regulator with XRE-family HTH domain
MITIAQCRAARGLLDWTQQDLAEASGLSKTAINNFEKGHSDIKAESLKAIRLAFEGADVEFMPDGVRKVNETTRIIRGPTAFNEMLNDVFEALKGGGEALIIWADDHLAQISSERFSEHLARMQDLGITARVISRESAPPLPARFAETRLLEPGAAKPGMMVIYGSRVALELWNNSMIVILNSPDAARAEKARFVNLWNAAGSGGGASKHHSAAISQVSQ